jgi:hypothetical protein
LALVAFFCERIEQIRALALTFRLVVVVVQAKQNWQHPQQEDAQQEESGCKGTPGESSE